jgi:hypothetical protein
MTISILDYYLVEHVQQNHSLSECLRVMIKISQSVYIIDPENITWGCDRSPFPLLTGGTGSSSNQREMVAVSDSERYHDYFMQSIRRFFENCEFDELFDEQERTGEYILLNFMCLWLCVCGCVFIDSFDVMKRKSGSPWRGFYSGRVPLFARLSRAKIALAVFHCDIKVCWNYYNILGGLVDTTSKGYRRAFDLFSPCSNLLDNGDSNSCAQRLFQIARKYYIFVHVFILCMYILTQFSIMGSTTVSAK